MVFGFAFVLLSQALKLIGKGMTVAFPQVTFVPDVTSRCI